METNSIDDDQELNCSLWDKKDERRVLRKIDISMLLLLVLSLLLFQLDRMNLASALTAGFTEAIGIDQKTVNLGNQLMFLGTVVLEIPSALVLHRIGPRNWLAGEVFSFGVIASFQVFLRNRAGFLATRSILGLAEAGFMPAALFTLSTWYTQYELARRAGILFFGMFGGSAVSPLLARGILMLEGKGKLSGWQWLFLLEGIFTIFVAILLFCFFPDSPDNPNPPVYGLIRFSEDEKEILKSRIYNAGVHKGAEAQTRTISPSKIWTTITYYKRWPHFICTSLVFSTWSPLMTYIPSIIMDLGFSRMTANALAAIGGFASLAVVFLFAWLSDRTNARGAMVIAAITSYLISLIVIRTVHPYVGRWSRFGLWTTVNGLAVGYHPVHNTWLQLNCRDSAERSISIVMWVSSAMTGLMGGTQIFQPSDKPFYTHGLTTMIILVSTGLAMAFLQLIIYRIDHYRSQRNLTSYEADTDTDRGTECLDASVITTDLK